MRTEPQMLDLIFQTAKVLQVEAVAMFWFMNGYKSTKR